jgi:hypothetical protein
MGTTVLIDPFKSAVAAPFSPDALTNLYVWYKADGTLWQNSARTTPAVANNDPVGAWDDASPNAKHVLQGSDLARPTYKTGGPNSKPYVTANNGPFLTASGLAGWTGGVTVFMVANGAGSTPGADFWLSFGSGDTKAIIAGFEGSGMVEWYDTPRTNVGSCDGSTWAVYEFVDLGTGAAASAIGLKNGTATETLTGSSKVFGTTMHLFITTGGSPAVANFAEVIAYKEGKGTVDRAAVRSYLGTKYGITVS